VIHNPSVLSQKYWITNGALHSNYAVVFAQTIVNGQNEGIHTFLVRIRDQDKKLCAGVGVLIEGLAGRPGAQAGPQRGRQRQDQVQPRAGAPREHPEQILGRERRGGVQLLHQKEKRPLPAGGGPPALRPHLHRTLIKTF